MFFNIRQYVNESAEEYITRMQQKVCDEEIPTRMLIKLIDRWLKQDVEDKNLDKEPKTMEDLMKFSKMAKSNLRSTKGKDVNIITSIENMKESLLTKLPVNFSLLCQYRLNKQTYPAKKKRKGAFSRPYSNRWHFQSFEAERNRLNFEDEPTYRQYDYSKKSQWQSNPSWRYQQYHDQPQWLSNPPPRNYQTKPSGSPIPLNGNIITKINTTSSLIVIAISFNISTCRSITNHLVQNQDSNIQQIVPPATMVHQHPVSVRVAV